MSKVIYERTRRFHLEGTDDERANGWLFLRGFDDEVEAHVEAEESTAWKRVRIVDTEAPE